MTKGLVTGMVIFMLASGALASDLWVLGLGKIGSEERGLSYDEIDISTGIAFYNDVSFYKDDNGLRQKDHNSSLAGYVQMPVAKWDEYRLSVGVTFPEDTSRTRASLALSVLLGEMFDTPGSDWFPLEVGASVLASPYEAWAIQFGLFRFDW